MCNVSVPPMPEPLCHFTAADGELVPAWLGDRDRPWLRDLVEAAAGAVGHPVAALHRRLADGEADPRAGSRYRMAAFVLARWLAAAARGPARSAARRQVFELRAQGVAAAEAYHRVAAAIGTPARELAATLYADLPARRLVTWPDPAPEPQRLALATNTCLVRGMLRWADHVVLRVFGGSRLVLRTAWLLGAAATVETGDAGVVTVRFREAAAAGRPRVSAALVPLLPWTRRFRLDARCRLGPAAGRLVLATGDPLLPAAEPRRFDSRLESAFAADFARLRPGWRLVREPAPLTLAAGLAFPDFAIAVDGGAPPWWCEIAGLRDDRALPQKLALLAHPRTVLCLPARAVPKGLQGHPRLVPFTRRVPVQQVAAVVEGGDGPSHEARLALP